MKKIDVDGSYLNRWLPKVERNDLANAYGFKAVSFLTDFKKLLEESGYRVEFKKSQTNLYRIVPQE